MTLIRFKTAEERFAHWTEKRGSHLIWTGTKYPKGYGQITVGGRKMRAHRYAWERVNGPIPEGMYVDHVCHTTECVNVGHLRLATPSQNEANRAGPTALNKSTGVRNVYPVKGRYYVRIRRNGMAYSFGGYATVEEASEVASTKRTEIFGEFAGRGKAAA